MGSRPSSFRKSGGFLNGVDGVITGYRCTDEFNGVPFKPGKNAEGKPKFHSLQFELSVRLDGADEDITQNLFAGGYEDYEVSENELTLTSPEGGSCSIGANTAVGKFISSLVAQGFPETNLSDDPNSINLEPIVGTRVRFGQEVEIDRKTGKPRQRTATKGKFAGKSFDQTSTIVEAVYEVPKSGAKGKSVAGKKVVGKGEQDVKELATSTLIEILEAATPKGEIAYAKVNMALIRTALTGPTRDAVKKVILNEDWLAGSEFWNYDGTTITLAASGIRALATISGLGPSVAV